jgi:hypothetical protein
MHACLATDSFSYFSCDIVSFPRSAADSVLVGAAGSQSTDLVSLKHFYYLIVNFTLIRTVINCRFVYIH